MREQPTKLCECGCGLPAPIAPKTCNGRGYRKGQPLRFIHGHHLRQWTGPANPHWGGGRSTRADDRVHVLVGKDHPMANADGYALTYRLVAAATVGRFLTPAETVHHIDLDVTNDDADNLAVVSHAQHARIHGLIRRGVDPVVALRRVGQILS